MARRLVALMSMDYWSGYENIPRDLETVDLQAIAIGQRPPPPFVGDVRKSATKPFPMAPLHWTIESGFTRMP